MFFCSFIWFAIGSRTYTVHEPVSFGTKQGSMTAVGPGTGIWSRDLRFILMFMKGPTAETDSNDVRNWST